jgi:hypothetical protein
MARYGAFIMLAVCAFATPGTGLARELQQDDMSSVDMSSTSMPAVDTDLIAILAQTGLQVGSPATPAGHATPATRRACCARRRVFLFRAGVHAGRRLRPGHLPKRQVASGSPDM